MKYKAPRGTRDLLPGEAEKWHFVESRFKELCNIYGFTEIRTPIFEETALFVRSMGEETDVVKKEMYIFKDQGGRELALRPEGTAGVVRAFIEHGIHNEAQPVKLFYYGPMFRYDRPQAGRQRQFYQMGIEIFGTKDPAVDVEVIKFSQDFFQGLGFSNLSLQINSTGCSECREDYLEQLSVFADARVSSLCGDCKERSRLNPLRLLDCKEIGCREEMKDAPRITDHLCSSCRDHFDKVLFLLDSLEIIYNVDHQLVRGLDYYTNTAFEFHSSTLGAQNSLGGGGRYDNLVEVCGGASTPGVGMAVGVERIVMAMEKEALFSEEMPAAGIFIAVGEQNDLPLRREALLLLNYLRGKGIVCDTDYLGRSLKAQMKFANRKRFRYVVILGGEDPSEGTLKVRDMLKGDQTELLRSEAIELLLKNCGK